MLNILKWCDFYYLVQKIFVIVQRQFTRFVESWPSLRPTRFIRLTSFLITGLRKRFITGDSLQSSLTNLMPWMKSIWKSMKLFKNIVSVFTLFWFGNIVLHYAKLAIHLIHDLLYLSPICNISFLLWNRVLDNLLTDIVDIIRWLDRWMLRIPWKKERVTNEKAISLVQK